MWIWIWLALEIKFATKDKSQTFWKMIGKIIIKKKNFLRFLKQNERGWNARQRNNNNEEETMKHAWKCSTASVDGIDEILQVNVYINIRVTAVWVYFFLSLVDCRARARSLIVTTFRYATVFLLFYFHFRFQSRCLPGCFVQIVCFWDSFLTVVTLVVFVVA